MGRQKYIICNSACANWGKSDTLLDVIATLKKTSSYKLLCEKPNNGKDKWCYFVDEEKSVVISTLGDPNSAQPKWLEDAAKTNANVIVTACRTRGSSVNAVYDVANRYGYEIIWFNNFHCDDTKLVSLSPMVDVKNIEVNCIANIINLLQ